MQVSEQEILTIYYKGYSALASLHGLLYQARKDFFQDGGLHKKKEHLSYLEDGLMVQVRYALSAGTFAWEKHGDRCLMEQVSSTPDGWALSYYNENGSIRSRIQFNKEHHLEQAEFFAPDGSVQELLSASTEKPGTLTLTRKEQNGEENHTVLLACPIFMGTAEQARIDSEVGEPQVIAARLDGDVCYCSQEEYQKRIELQERLKSGAISLIPIFTPDKPASAPPTIEEKKNEKKKLSNPLANPEPQIGIADLMEQIRKMEEGLGIRHGEICRNSQLMQDLPKKDSTQPDVPEAQCNPCEEATPEQEEKIPPVRYTVAKCGFDGTVRAPGLSAPIAPELPEVAEEIPPAVHHIVISQTEHYLYYGELLGGERHGRGRTEMPGGNTAYEGTYSRGMRDGFGAFYYRTGRLCYAGSWRNNLRDGAGVGFRPDGSGLYAGMWQGDRPGTSGAVLGADGAVCYAGALQDGQRHGVGVSFRRKDGTLLVARWQNGVPSGEVTLFDANGCICYSGEWKNGVRHGVGTSYTPNGQIEFSGEWQNGSPVCGE